MATTLKEIAARAKVTEMTVSNILNGRYVPARAKAVARADRIRSIAAELGYRPNGAAKAMATGRFGAFALLQSTEFAHSVLPGGLLSGIHAAMEPHNLHLVVSRLPDQQLTARGFVPKLLREMSADGLLVNYSANIPAEMIRLIDRHQLPAVWINSQQPANCVYPDDLAASIEATKALLVLGHTRITYIDYTRSVAKPASHYSVTEREAGYATTMQNAGLTPHHTGSVEALHELLRVHRELVALLSGPDRPTAVVCYGPRESRSVAAAALTLGLDLPRDLSIIMFADSGSYDEMGIHFATMVVPEAQVGQRAVEMLIKRIDTPGVSQPAVSLPFTLKPEQTLAAPPPK